MKQSQSKVNSTKTYENIACTAIKLGQSITVQISEVVNSLPQNNLFGQCDQTVKFLNSFWF